MVVAVDDDGDDNAGVFKVKTSERHFFWLRGSARLLRKWQDMLLLTPSPMCVNVSL